MKSLKKNYVYNLIYQIVAIVSPLITAPYISRVLEPENIGTYSYTQSIVSYVILLTTLGTTMYAQREIAFFQGNKEEQTKTLIELLMLRVGLGVIGLITILLLIIFYDRYRVLFAIQSIELFANMICIDWFYAGNEEFKTIMTRNFVIRAMNISCIFLFVKNSGDLYKYVLIIVLGTFIGNASLWFKMKHFISGFSLKSLYFRRHIAGSISIFAAQISASIYSMLDKTMIGIITASSLENGYYEQAQKIERIALTFVTALGTVILPKISKANHSEDSKSVENSIFTSFNYMWLVALPMMFGLISTASSFVPWFYGKGYEKSIVLIQILALLLVAIGINNITGVQYLLSTNKEKILTFTELFGAIINVILNLILIGKIASVGAAIASVAAEGTVAIAQLFYIRKSINVKKIIQMSLKYLVSSMIMFIVIEVIKFKIFNHSTILDSIILVMVGVIIYLIMLIVLRESFLIGKLKTVIKSRTK